MTVREMCEHLKSIIEVHPEAEEAAVWGESDDEGFKFPIKAIGWDKRHKPPRIKLEG